MEARTSSWEMFFGNVLDQLSSAALLDLTTLEAITADVDAKVEQLQECVADSSSGIKLVTSGSNQQATDQKDSHCESDLLALNCFLTNVVQALECNQGLEDSILKELLSFCSRNGFLLPPVSSEIEQNDMGSSASLNTISAAEEETKLTLWMRIKSKVKKGITTKLQQSNILSRAGYEQPGYQKEIARRVQLIDLLMVLFPIDEILDLYIKTRLNKLEQVLAGTKKQSVSWADDEDIEKVKVLENLEIFIVNQLNMLNMDVSVLWKINEYMLTFSISDVIKKVYFPQLQNALKKAIRCFTVSGDQTKGSNLLLPVENPSSSATLSSMDDIRFITKAFAIACNWESEVKEVVDFFAVKPERRFSGAGLRSVLKAPSNIYPPTGTFEGLARIIWDEDNDKKSFEEKWQWRDVFKELIPDLCKAVTENLHSAERYIEGMENEKELELVYVHECLFHEHPKYPQKVPMICAKMVSLYDEIIPLASFLGGTVFEPLQAVFIESVSSFLRSYHKNLNETLRMFPESPNVYSLYSLICTVTFFQQHLEFYEENMTNLRKKPFQHFIKLFNDLLDSARSTVILYHIRIITTSLLFDVQSNNWSDSKPFFEGERYSYCIQMWSYYINCIHKDIWYTLPQIESEKILYEIMTKSLVILTGRYSKIRPSFARTKQLRCDVAAICDVTTWLCWKLASVPSEILFRDVEDVSEKRKCHCLCANMIANMIFVSTPLKTIADHLTSPRSAEDSGSGAFEPSKLLFLWSEPSVFLKPINSLNEMDGREAVFVIFKLIVSQSHPKWPLVCQAMLMRNALLPTLIASYADVFIESSSSLSSPDINNLLNDNFYVYKTTESSSLDLKSFFEHVYLILFKASSKSDAFAHFLMAIANRENAWGLFDNHVVLRAKATHETPIWLHNVEKTLIPFLSRSFLPALEMICDADRRRSEPSFAFTNLEMLPCGCATIPEDTSNLFSSEGELLYHCLVSTLNAFTENLNTIPRIIAVFFNRLNDYLYQRHFSAATKSPGLKILAFISYKWLTTQENICLLFDFPMSDDTIVKIKCFAELVWYLLFNLTTDVSQNQLIPSDILSYIKTHKVWLQEKLKMLTNYFKASVVQSTAGSIDQLPDEVAENQYLALSSTLLVLPDCREALQTFYQILIDNQEKIEEKLLSSRGSSFDQKIFTKAAEASQVDTTLNPLRNYNRFGDYIHDQEQTIDSQINWSKWLHISEKYPVATIRRVILGRQEFLPESYEYLTDEEKIAHEKLLRHFENCTPSFPERPLSSSSSSTRSSSVTE